MSNMDDEAEGLNIGALRVNDDDDGAANGIDGINKWRDTIDAGSGDECVN